MQTADACVATSGWLPLLPDDEWPVVVVMFILGYFTCKLFMLSSKVPAGPPHVNTVVDPASKLLGRMSLPGRKAPVDLSDDEHGQGCLN
mmetsp:Transcript_114672/g.228186  ORF Transcript_114672/g.228186 Transcript_114672/m.228186 type:complete len:89 (-) Transcript_114672:82-348(-)